MDLKLTYYDNTTSIQRVNISQNPQTFDFDLPKIKSLQIDPNGWLLFQTGSVTSSSSFDSNGVWISVGPNPFIDKIQFQKAQGHQEVLVTISDVAGKILIKDKFTDQHFELDASKLSNGIYIVRISDGKRTSSYKLIKE
jgi:hypothetical protein